MKKINITITLILLNIFISSNYVYSKNSNKLYEKIDLFSEVLETIKQEYVDEIDQTEIMDSAINGVLQSLDPYSSYMSPKSYEGMQTDTKGKFGGLGIEIGMESGVVKVISPIDDTPAANAGIKAGDYIVKINDEQVQGKTLTEAVELMRGPIGSKITLTVRRKNEKKALEFKIKRAIIEVKSVEAKIIGEKKEIGYLRLKSFNENSDEQLFKNININTDAVITLIGEELDAPGSPVLTADVHLDDHPNMETFWQKIEAITGDFIDQDLYIVLRIELPLAEALHDHR